jgi:DNA polymerase-3 subunit epsilon
MAKAEQDDNPQSSVIRPGTGVVKPPLKENSWARKPLVAFDVETTGTDIENDRILTASVSIVEADGSTKNYEWLVNPGIEIPEDSIAIHGVTNEQAAKGTETSLAVEEIVNVISQAANEGYPIVAFNARFDMSILDREAKRNQLETVYDQANPIVIDPFVLDKQMDRYRKGSRRLVAVCEQYGIEFPEEAAHDAEVDAVNAAKLARAICEEFPEELDISPRELMEKQTEWAREQAEGLSAYLTEKHGREININPHWPVAK